MHFKVDNEVFIPIPKNASSAICSLVDYDMENVISVMGHFDIDEAKHRYGKNIYTFGIFREPIEWLYSMFMFFKKDIFMDTIYTTSLSSFDTFCIQYLNYWQYPAFVYKTQSEYSYREYSIDKLYLMKDIELLVNHINKMLGTNYLLPVVNKRPYDLDMYIKDTTRDKITEFFSNDYKIYNKLIKNS